MSYFITNDCGKNQYEKVGEIRTQSTLHPAFIGLIFLSFCMIFIILSLWNIDNTINPKNNTYVFYLKSKHSLLHTVSNKFLSFGLDTSLLRDIKNLPIKNNKFINLAQYLAPAYIRIGGTSADCLYFNQTIISEKAINPVDGQDITNFTINEKDFENLYNFSIKSKLRMIFDLNVLIRNINGSWNDINAKNIISFAKNKNMKIDWQLGNGYSESLLVGPEVNHVGDINRIGEHYAKTFLENDKNSINYVTWHQYYLNGKEAQLIDFINISIFNYLPKQIKSMQEAIQSSGKIIPMWLSETSTAYGGGAPELSNRFVAGFLWLDKLGYSASAGLNTVIRQSLFGGNYAMIGPDLIPNPDWWVSVIYKQFVSEKVLKLSSTSFDYLRLYAHCTPEKSWINKIVAITIYGINLYKYSINVTIQGIPISHKNSKVFLYALTSNNLQSRDIKINGEVLKLQSNGSLPLFQPIILESTQLITLPSYSMIFIVIHGAYVPACHT
ncbi:heparanase isoform X2 [Apis mellifera]|uniref:Heparanase isoform X2 n=1 Tax=Apis mellifera TaxID=7460 RepID=A0A7M7MUB1_APIME|nr:heparanase isoform X2 [Apis mellifera]|eukprot:XP_026301238.1 heparanase isoform X2 [Apis mellifera]